jgi:hypothetical protein
MTDIIVYTRPEVLEHKIESWGCYWDLPNKPKRKLDKESRIYFATKGFVRGSFAITDRVDNTIYFDDWEPLHELIPQKPFQGFKYSNN